MLSESQNACRVDTNWCRSGRDRDMQIFCCANEARFMAVSATCGMARSCYLKALQSRELKGIEQLVILFGEHHFRILIGNQQHFAGCVQLQPTLEKANQISICVEKKLISNDLYLYLYHVISIYIYIYVYIYIYTCMYIYILRFGDC